MYPQRFILILSLLTVCSLLAPSHGYRVLGLFPLPVVSHYHFFQPIMRELADIGHNVTVISYFPDKDAPSNYHDIVLDESPLMTNSLSLSVNNL